MKPTPNCFRRRSSTYSIHDASQYQERGNSVVVSTYGAYDSLAQITDCALLDLSECRRTGVRGAGAPKLLARLGYSVPESVNQSLAMPDGTLVARLGSTECWLLAHPLAEPTAADFSALDYGEPNDQCHSLYCQHSHAWFALTGHHLAPLMAKVCAVDLSAAAFPVGAIAQTSVARVNAIVIHHQLQLIPVFYLLVDSSSAHYLWHALSDAMQEFDGRPVGINAFHMV